MEARTALDLILRSTEDVVSGETKVAVAYSGGLDSSVIARAAKRCAEVHCYACVVRGSFDDRNVRIRAESESLDLTTIELETDMIPSILRETAEALGTSNPTHLAYTIPVFVVLKESREKLVLAGSGADELFGGYAKYASARNPEHVMADDLEKMLREVDALRQAAIAIGKIIGFPFTSKELIDLSRSLPLEMKISPSERKILLRNVAKLLDLPSHNLPKKAAQYSSGILKEMRKLAKVDGKSLADWTRGVAQNRERSS